MEENPQTETPVQNEMKNEDKKWSLREFLKFAVIAAIIVLPVRFFVAEPYLVKGESMLPTFQNNDYLIVEKINYLFNPPERGEVVIFNSPIEKGKSLIKRIVGLPGEEIKVTDSAIIITKKDGSEITLKEPYVKFETVNPNSQKILGDDEYFVAGDNRPVSYDSRFWGPLNKKNIIGRPVVRLYHFNSVGGWPGIYNSKD